MHFPVFSRGSNPTTDRPILRKSRSYIETEVSAGRARWVDCADPKRGIIAREMLYFGPPRQYEPERTCSLRGGKLKFVLPDASRAARVASRVLMVRPLPYGGVLIVTTEQLRTR